mgnify:FL=1|tara:strand:+ start:1377 stop:2375 length:999 start_codon:yes stop_codon:yes gene_type:complete
MSDLDTLVENYFAPKKKTLTKQILYEIFDEIMREQEIKIISGQQSERNLVENVNKYVSSSGGSVSLNVGELGSFNVTGAAQQGGGNPEPKADLVLYTDSPQKPEIGLSMKKENFAFLENWMDRKKLMLRLTQVGLEDSEAIIIIDEIISDLKMLTDRVKETISAEKQEFIKIAKSVDPEYTFPDFITPEILRALENSEGFSRKGKFKNNFKIPNYYANLSDILEGQKYFDMLNLIIGGGEENPKKADGVLISNVPTQVSLQELQNILNKTISIESAVRSYADDEKINIRFRLRPITKVRTTYSRTNRGKYKVGQRLFEDPELGVSWTVSVTK